VSELDKIIAPEIANDEFAFLLTKLVAQEELNSVLEIGASSGAGSTEAIYQGVLQSRRRINVYSMEVSAPRFEALQKRYAREPRMHRFHVSSVQVSAFPTEQEIETFYHTHQTNLNQYPLPLVLGWLKQDIDYIRESSVPENGIELIKEKTGVKLFDLVLIDGSEFTGQAELKEVYGAKFIVLDDILTYKNFQNHRQLQNDPGYVLLAENVDVRNGYSVFRRKDVVAQEKNYDELLRTFRSKISAPRPKKRGLLKRLWSKFSSKE